MPVVKGQLRGTEDIHPLTGARGGTNLIPIRSRSALPLRNDPNCWAAGTTTVLGRAPDSDITLLVWI